MSNTRKINPKNRELEPEDYPRYNRRASSRKQIWKPTPGQRALYEWAEVEEQLEELDVQQDD